MPVAPDAVIRAAPSSHDPSCRRVIKDGAAHLDGFLSAHVVSTRAENALRVGAKEEHLMTLAADIFDPAHYTKVSLPPVEAESLPPWCYTDEAFFAREVRDIFMRGWNFLGRVERVAAPGDYLALDFAGIPILLLRDRAGVLRCFANACRHRGALLLEGAGNCRAVQCPYHAWTYGLDGTLQGAPDMERTVGFEKAAYGLTPIRLEVWAGFMFVCFDSAAPGLMDYLGDLPATLAPYRLDEMVPTYRQEYDTPYVHGRSIYAQPVSFLGQAGCGMAVLPNDPQRGAYNFFFMPHEGTRSLLPGDTGFEPMAHLPESIRRGSYFGFVFPCMQLSCHNDVMWFMEIYPVGPGHIRLAQVGCFPPSAMARPDFEVVAARYYKRWALALEEDIDQIELQQRGLASPLARPGRVCHVEDKLQIFRRMVVERVIGNQG
jgi:choline monooxygenase